MRVSCLVRTHWRRSAYIARPVLRVPTRFFSNHKDPEGGIPTPAGWAESEEGDLDWDDLESDFAAGESFNPEEFAELSAQDISEMSERPPYEIDELNPPKLKKIHYHMVKDINPELYEEWVKLRTVQWKLQNKLKPLSKFQFSNSHLQEYDKMPQWSKPTPRKKTSSCRLCIPDLTPNKENQITFTNLELLHKYVNERGMILNRRVSGNCGRHQRAVAKAIKQARLAGLMAFTSNWKIPETFLAPADSESVKIVPIPADGFSSFNDSEPLYEEVELSEEEDMVPESASQSI